MRLQFYKAFFLQKLFQVFTKMAVIVIAIFFITEISRRMNQLLHRFSYT